MLDPPRDRYGTASVVSTCQHHNINTASSAAHTAAFARGGLTSHSAQQTTFRFAYCANKHPQLLKDTVKIVGLSAGVKKPPMPLETRWNTIGEASFILWTYLVDCIKFLNMILSLRDATPATKTTARQCLDEVHNPVYVLNGRLLVELHRWFGGWMLQEQSPPFPMFKLASQPLYFLIKLRQLGQMQIKAANASDDECPLDETLFPATTEHWRTEVKLKAGRCYHVFRLQLVTYFGTAWVS